MNDDPPKDGGNAGPGSGGTRARGQHRKGWKRKFLNAFAKKMSIEGACWYADINESSVRKAFKIDPKFRERFERLKSGAKDRVWGSTHERALEGNPKLLEFLMRGYFPEQFNRAPIPPAPPDTNVDDTAAMLRAKLREMDASVDGPPTAKEQKPPPSDPPPPPTGEPDAAP